MALTKRLIRIALNAAKPGFNPLGLEEYCREEDLVIMDSPCERRMNIFMRLLYFNNQLVKVEKVDDYTGKFTLRKISMGAFEA